MEEDVKPALYPPLQLYTTTTTPSVGPAFVGSGGDPAVGNLTSTGIPTIEKLIPKDP